LIQHLVDEALALHAVQKRVLGVAQALDHEADLAAERVAGQVADARQVELIDELAVNEPLELFEALARAAFQPRFPHPPRPADVRVAAAQIPQTALQTRHGAVPWCCYSVLIGEW